MPELDLCTAINKKLIEYIVRFPVTYMDILREQIAECEMTNEYYSDRYIVHFHCKNNVRQLPLWLPTVPQGCQVLKENSPMICQLYVENGYIVQFEVIDMGMNEIDWECLWSNEPIFYNMYDISKICNYLIDEKYGISGVRIGEQYVYLKLDNDAESHTICFYDCNFRSSDLLHKTSDCKLDICISDKDKQRYAVKIDNNPVFECSLVCFQDDLNFERDKE